jgi:hypothetical protein
VASPLAYSINWTSPLEVAIRGVNLAACAALFAEASEADLRLLVETLALHGAFLSRNIEYTDIRGNHYTGNLLGLLTMGFLLEELVPEARRWREYAETRIPTEVMLQFHRDGVNFEKSVPYHRFVTEMFLLSAVLLHRAGRPLSSAVTDRLHRAVRFTSVYTRPDGRAPVVGDNDNARALPLSSDSVEDHRHLLALAAIAIGDASPLEATHPGWTEAFWLSNDTPVTTGGALLAGAAFADGGFYIAREGNHFLFVDAGEVGLQTGGCHGHHDMLSFELALNGVPLVVDPGSPAYTGNVALKNRFRRTAAHNTALVDGTEQGSFDPTRLWHLGAEARPRDVRYAPLECKTVIEAAHVGYERLSQPVIHRRSFELVTDGSFAGTDSFTGEGEHELEIFFHFDAAVRVTEDGAGRIHIAARGRDWYFTWSPSDTHGTISEGEVSPSYGVRLSAPVLRLRHQGALPWQLHYRIEPATT